MKKLACEMCGSNDLVKENGLFVCQYCGAKYTVEEARKLMSDDVVSVQGTVKIDHSDDLDRLYKAARNAREALDYDVAIRHYESITEKDPNSWEALFYLATLKTRSIKNSEIYSAAARVSNSLSLVFDLVRDTIKDEDEKKKIVLEIINECYEVADWLTGCSQNFYKSLTKGNGVMALTGVFGAITSISETTSAQDEDQTRRVAIANIMCYCGLYIEERFDMTDEDYCAYAVWSWQKMLEFHENYRSVNSYRALFDKESVERFNNKILKYSPKILEDTSATVLIISYVSTGGAPMQLWYSIDGSDKYILPSGESCQHFLEIGEHTFRTLNPFNKKTQTIVVDGETRVNVQGKGLKMIIN